MILHIIQSLCSMFSPVKIYGKRYVSAKRIRSFVVGITCNRNRFTQLTDCRVCAISKQVCEPTDSMRIPIQAKIVYLRFTIGIVNIRYFGNIRRSREGRHPNICRYILCRYENKVMILRFAFLKYTYSKNKLV